MTKGLYPHPYSPQQLSYCSIHSCGAVLGPVNKSASETLFANAAREEAKEEGGRPTLAEGRIGSEQHENWTGEESVQDAVLRMLVDKYKPHRSGPIRTADQKLKDSPPQRVSGWQSPTSAHSWQEIADTPLLPSLEGHRPWHTTFKAPSHATASIKLGNFAPSSARSSAGSDESCESAKRTERELAKRKQQARRLSHARESTLDYRFGLTNGRTSRINPVNLKGWQSLVEDRIENARLSGQFDKVKGRGLPIVRLSEEHNPFIAREEFLMNRIVRRNGAAPPWVEVQIELEAAANAFRDTLRQSWTRRAIRIMTVARLASSIPPLSWNTVISLRDREWEERERSYHDTAIAELNSLVRKYNAMAPYAVRRPYYARETELTKAYHNCAEEILRGTAERSRTALYFEAKPPFVDDSPREVHAFFGLWRVVVQWLRALRRRFTKAS